ncbi:MAG: hypothetical protein WD313_01365, partial [Acidimicrobiia bacterium]
MLVVHDEHVATEELGGDVDGLHPLTGTSVLVRRDEADRFGIREVRDVDDPRASIRTGLAAL